MAYARESGLDPEIGSAHCPVGPNTSRTIHVISAEIGFYDDDPYGCMNCYWYAKTATGGTYYIPGSKRYSVGPNDDQQSCSNPAFQGAGTLVWSSSEYDWGTVTNVTQVAALCRLRSSPDVDVSFGLGDFHWITHYALETEILLGQ